LGRFDVILCRKCRYCKSVDVNLNVDCDFYRGQVAAKIYCWAFSRKMKKKG